LLPECLCQSANRISEPFCLRLSFNLLPDSTWIQPAVHGLPRLPEHNPHGFNSDESMGYPTNSTASHHDANAIWSDRQLPRPFCLIVDKKVMIRSAVPNHGRTGVIFWPPPKSIDVHQRTGQPIIMNPLENPFRS
jgi:hypothetical protein